MIGDPPLDGSEPLLLSSDAIIKRESRTRRRVGILTGVGVLIAFAAMGSFTYVANEQRMVAEQQSLMANQERQLAETQKQLAAQARSELEKTTVQLETTTQLAETQKQLAAQARSELEKTTVQLETTTQALVTAKTALSDSQAQIEELRKQLSQIYDFKQHVVPITEVDEKVSYSAIGPKGFDVLQVAIQDSRKKLPFNGANDEHKGFTSPGYAQYLLGKVGISQPVATLKSRVGPPQSGDIIAYNGGYHMFYFSIPSLHKEFVIGMTPEGVLALEPDFGTRTKVYAALRP